MSTCLISRAPLSPSAKAHWQSRYADAAFLSLTELDSDGRGLRAPYALRYVPALTVGEITAALSSLKGSVLHKEFFGDDTPDGQISLVLTTGDGPSWLYRVGRGRFFACLGKEPAIPLLLLQDDTVSILSAEP